MRRLSRACAATAMAISATIAYAGRAHADAPAQQGWWWQGNPGAAPVAGVSASQPPPDVPARGLLIEGGPNSTSGAGDSNPTAFAALVYQFSPGTTARTLTLNVAQNSASTPSVTLELCRLPNPGIDPEQGGPMADAPSYNCKINVTAQASPNGNSFQFNVPDLVTNDALAVAILPTGSTDRVVLSQPSLSVQSGGVTTGDFSPQASAPPPPSLAPSAASTPGGGSTAQTMPSGPAGTASLSALPPAICDSQHSYGTPASSSGTHGSSLSAAGNAVSSFTSTSTGSNNAKPLAVALSIVVFLLGAGAWLTAGRAAGRAALLDGQSAPA